MAPNNKTFQGCARGGRLLVTAAAICCLLLPAPSASAASPATVSVREKGGVYTVAARFVVDHPQSVVRAVLTDYEQIPRFMPGVRTSVVRERATGRAVVEQEAESSVLAVSRSVHLILEIVELPDALIFHDRCRRSFVGYDGAWRFSYKDGQTTITYELIAEPSFDVPGFMLKRLLRRDSARMIDNVEREIATRANTRAALIP